VVRGGRRSAGRRIGAGLFLRGWLADFGEQTGRIDVGLAEQILAADLRADGLLHELRCRQTPAFTSW
jgi:hypothetical protein